ncbi:glucose-6-phosphate dehydrogenase assembly protein OpcA [Williamsia sterculiae]|uniref:Glucose-6-phosphate dehydrogenase assembly protein OpcA n=1 Tax=Williamsia sterculiae TaxID=1344003 RepID=A0A1N7EJ17_9NOCA|nr:glucose-6-phosphate dehydrogenase assembly protein OpcA [Williamsia sterculiae]SIR88102.1 glucose-6-phosphate dehydrogenase assembly protein OpcA [Williamsia sterculiae]
MKIDLPDTSTENVAKQLVMTREHGGAVTLGRVLTLVVVTDIGEPTEGAIDAANAASREHPCRVIVVASGERSGESRLDAEIRVGGDAGASEVVVLKLRGELANHGHSVVIPFLLADTPVVTWWPGVGPDDPAGDPMGQLGGRRITDASKADDPLATLGTRLGNYSPGDSDLAWARITYWRAILASAIDRPPHTPITSATVTGPAGSPSIDLLAGWLRTELGVQVDRGQGSFEVRLDRDDGTTVLAVDEDGNAILISPGKPDGRIAMSSRDVPGCLTEELRRLDPDEIYHQALQGMSGVKGEVTA